MWSAENNGFCAPCEHRPQSRARRSNASQVVTGKSRPEKEEQSTDATGMENDVRVSRTPVKHEEKGPRSHVKADRNNGNQNTTSSKASRGEEGSSQDGNVHQAPPVLAIEWKRFPYDFARGEFEVHGFPLYIEGHSRIRPAHLQQDADTGKSIWDGSVVLARFVAQRLFPLPQAREPSSSAKDSRVPRSNKGAPGEGNTPPRRVVLELGAGVGVAGLAAAAALAAATRASRDHQRREGEVKTCQGIDRDACATQRDVRQTSQVSNIAGIGVSGTNADITSPQRNQVIVTDLPYCLEALAENIRRNRHFAVERKSSARTADAEESNGSAHDAVKTQTTMDPYVEQVKSEVSVWPLDWNEPDKFAEISDGVLNPGEVQVLLGADIVWLTSLVEPLVKTIDWFFEENRKWMLQTTGETRTEETEKIRSRPSPLVAYISHQTRSEKTDEMLFRTLSATGLEVEIQQFDDPVANRSPNIRILKIWKSR
ncbi:conserved hypothetical protein [Neospora caninum Liverpool]|uniref:Methyltransferase n=1 Tax=Neospora caninum (strain Liverpool) TaxID=572307 RepID=F0VKJ4_NEOCL|nr:conserved hypothetical protein [Neospora caninum Liverpool]CBZ54595.1 conserved hypothetical protein [Neospora caninum Liverpool]CEL69309.1 TPA: hypothetical protein BN1204_050230 [Neospora caninum Liverpool]|eukprot:XP_003884625.1 conserved hypothetical protein [Neospora caninum Liverpool]